VAHFVFRWLAYDGELLPNTWWAKAEGYLGLTPWEYVRDGALAPVLGVAGLLAGVVGWAVARPRARQIAASAASAGFHQWVNCRSEESVFLHVQVFPARRQFSIGCKGIIDR